jgi:hypothetical protein
MAETAQLRKQPRGIGPIPRGRYTIGPPHHGHRTGAYVMDLTPVGHDAHRRTEFQIHGETVDPNRPRGEASTGCIVTPRNVRERIFRSGDHVLEVVR